MTRRAAVWTLLTLVAAVALGYWMLAQLFAVHGLSAGGSDEGAVWVVAHLRVV